MKNYQHTVDWFLARICKRVYRKKLSCPCAECQKTYVDIRDEQHARYIHLCHNEMGIKYYDKEIK